MKNMPMRRQVLILSIVIIIATLAMSAFFLHGRDNSGGNAVERRAELWAHKRLMRVRKGIVPGPFITDGCSGGMSALWQSMGDTFPVLTKSIGTSPPWEQCCVTHDKAYFDAADTTNAEQSFDARLVADHILSKCVADFGKQQTAPAKHEYQLLADMMYSAVRLGGAPCSGLPWRWGYGLPNCHIGNAQ